MDQEVPENDLPEGSPAETDRNPASAAPQAVSGQEVSADDLPQESGSAVPDEDIPQNLVSDYTTPGQQAKTALEGAAQGLAGPAATWAETHLLGVDPQNIVNRQEANPIIHGASEAGTFAGSMLLGTGEAALLSKIGEAAAKATEFGKVGSSLIKGAVEGGLFQGGDEISKAILGQGDPNEPVSSALLHTGAASLMGAAGGAAIESFAAPVLSKIGESKMGTRFSQFLSDMGSRLKFNQENPNMVDALGEQLENLHSSLGAARDDIYGASQMKAQNIKLLTQDVTPEQLNQHIGDVTQMLLDAPDEIQNDPTFKNAAQNWKKRIYSAQGSQEVVPPSSVSPNYNGIPETVLKAPRPTAARIAQMGEAGSAADAANLDAAKRAGFNPYNISPPQPSLSSPDEIFQATDQLKRQIQKLGKFGYTGSAASVVADQAKPLSGALADTLENEGVWNKAGKFQKGLNEAVSDFIPKNDNFVSQFTAKDATDPNRIISPGKVNTYLNQLGKPNAEIKQKFLGGWVDAAQKYQEQINGLHQSLGLTTPLTSPPTDVIRSTLGDLSPGAKAADTLYHLGIPKFAQSIGGTAVGGEVGYREGGIKGAVVGGITGAIAGAIAPHLEEAALMKLRQSAVPALIRVLSSNAPETAGAALNYAASAAKGASRLSKGIDALFKSGGTQAIDAYASDSDKEKLHKYVENGEMNRQIQAQSNQPAPAPPPVQYFAEGGEVKNPLSNPVPTTPAQPVLKSVGGIEKAMPEHASILSAAKSRVNDYLNSVRPQQNTAKLAFDSEPQNTVQHRSYQKALDLAAQPLGVLNHMKAGTLTPELLNHFKSLWPELHDHVSKKLTQKIVESQMNGEKPSYRVRQSMSLFMGTPLDSTMTPQAIQSIQSIYAQKSAPQQGAAPKAKKGTSKLGEISKDHYTQEQASAQRVTQWD